MFDQFSDYANSVVVTGRNHAKEFGHEQVGDEHFLLGLIEVEDGAASEILQGLGLTSETIRQRLLDLLPQTPNHPENPPFTENAKRVLQIAFRYAKETEKDFQVKTEHLLYAISEETGGMASIILSDLKVTNRNLKEKLNEFFAASNPNDSNKESVSMGGGRDKESGTQMLNKFGKDFTQMAKDGKIDPVIGRANEIKRIVQILSRRTKNNPILVGDPGVGKTAVVEGLALAINNQEVPINLLDKKVYSLDLGAMLAGTQFRGMFEDRLKKVFSEIIRRGDIILFIDEIHTLVGAGSGGDSSMDAAQIMKPMLARGELQTVGATTSDEYSKHFEKDAALVRRFQPVKVPEPTPLEAIEILKGLRSRYEAHHRVTIDDDAIDSAVKLSARYVSDRFLPDKAIDLMDEAAAKIQVEALMRPTELKDAAKKIADLKVVIQAAADEQDYPTANKLKDELKDLEKNFAKDDKSWKDSIENNKQKVTSELVAEVLEMSTGVPVTKMTKEETKRLIEMEDELHKRIVGQHEAVTAVSKSIRRARAGLKDPKRPAGSFIFAGPTGVGKTELTKALAEYMFGDESSIIQLDMSEYQERFEASKLFGSSPGYVGYEEGGQLTEKVRRNPYSIVLLDEIEKAHPDIFNSFLQVLEEGHMTDGKGRVIDFKNVIIVMTTNLGSGEIAKGISVGFGDDENFADAYERMKAKVQEDLKKNFRPEFINRLDDVIVFEQLSKDDILQIVDLTVGSLGKRLLEKNIKIELNDDAKQWLSKKGYDPLLGARPLRRLVTREIEDILSEQLLFGKLKEGMTVKVSTEDKKLAFEYTK
jgi:ATP-dependent Clp protease ATP-binding subunit ClpC